MKDVNSSPMLGYIVSWTTTKGTLSSTSTATYNEGKAPVHLRHTRAETATVNASVYSVA
ncbi:Ig-like domain-containing protein [Pantoea agglomerans]